jgi:hypothetical protein
MLKKYILYTPCLQKSLNLELAKAKMRITIGLYESTLADVINDVKELSYKYLSKTIVPTSDRSTLSSLKDISGVNDISIAYSLHLTNLTYESISKFVDIYVENIDLQQYFIRSIKDVYNAYNFMVKDDISNAFDNLKQSIETDANTVEKNASLAKTYSGYYKLIADNKEAAYTEYDRTSTLKNNVLTLLSKFKMDRVLAKPILELSADVLSANVVDAESIAINTRSDLVLKPISDAYTAHQEEITNGVRGILQNEISKFEAEITKLGTLANFLSDDVKTAANALKSTPNDKTPDATLSTSNIIDKINKYKQLMDSVKTQTDPIKGTVYEQARAQTGAIIDRYVLHFQQVARISNGAILVYKPTETSPNLGTINQIQAQANYDKTQLAKSSNVEVFYNMYVQKEKTLLETLYAYGISIIDDGFLPLYKTIEEKGLESYISDTMKNAKADVDANRNKMENKTMVFDDTLQILTTYANISENTKLEVKRAEARQVIEKVIALLEEIATAGITINYSDIIPDTDSAKKALTNVSIVKTLPILQQVIDQYTSVLASIETQFNAYASNIIQDFITFYKDAEQQNIIDFLPEAAKTAALTADADLASVNKKTKIEVAAFIEKYSDAKLVGEKAFSDSKTAISLRRIQNQTLTYITTFKTNLAAARDISSLLADLATLDASVQKDTETVNSKSVSTTTLSSLQKTYYTLNNQVTTKVKQALIDTVTTFTRAVASAKAKAATIPTKVRLAAATFVADIKKAEAGGLTVLEMRDMQRNYAELTALVAGGLPASADLTAGRSELLQMIQTFETLVGSVGSAKVTFTSGVKQANPTADRATTEKASRIEDILALRTKYVQMIYEVTTKLEEAREAAKAALDAKKTEATAAITSFQSQIAKTAIKLADYPQVTSARDAIDRSLQILADPSTTLETATSLLDTYKTAMDTLNYGQSASSASDRAAKQQVTLLGMSRFTEVYKSNLDVASRFSTSLRTLALSLPSDITTVQSPTTALGDLDAIRKKYDDATTQILTELVGIQQDKVSETIALVRTFIQQYNQVPNIDVLPSYLRLDVRLMNADLDTLGSPAVSETTINELRQKYEGWSKALIAAVPNVSQRLYATSADKERLGNTLRELNQLFMENMGVFGSVSTQLRNRIQKIADVARYIRGDSVGSAEVTGLLEDYRAALEEFKGVLLGKPVTQSVVDASLKAILAKFVDTYKESDIYKLGKEEFNYIQLLVRNQTNVYVTQDVAGAIKAYSRGIDLLKTVPKAGQVTENAPYNKLVETINYFMSEWSLRNLGRAIANDRLYLTNLKNNATSYTELYKTPPPNLKNYGVIVDGLVDQYLQGLRLLRTYPLKK